MREALWAVVAACMLSACAMDCKSREVYNVTWWVSGAAAAILLLFQWETFDLRFLTELGVFVLLQLKLFAKMYGRADCYAFCVCAVAEAAAGLPLAGYLLHMLLAFLLLALVQALRRNIDRKGNLRRPVAFLPYITLAFCVVLWYSVT